MTDNQLNATVFQCECGKRFTSEAATRIHQKIHGENVFSASAGAGSAQKLTTERGEDNKRTGNQQGREENQQGFREPKGSPVPAATSVHEVKDEHEWKHGKQEDDTENKMASDWGKSDKH
jgi:hypothetical protein